MTEPSDNITTSTEFPVNRRNVLRGMSLTALLTVAGTNASAATTQAGADTAASPDTEISPVSEYQDNLLWYRTGDKAGREQFREAIPTVDGGLATLGLATTSDDGIEAWQYTWKADGDKRWTVLHGQSGFDAVFGGIRTANNGYALCGRTKPSGTDTGQVYVVKTTPNGQEQWTQRFHIRRCVNDRANDIVQTTDGGFVVTGISGGRAALAKLTSEGEVRWTETYTGGQGIEAVSVVGSDDGFTIAGTLTNEDGATDFLLLRTDASGREKWRQTYAAGEYNGLTECIQTDDGYVLAGTTQPEDAFTTDALFIKTTLQGDVVWQQTYGQEGADFTADGITPVRGGYVTVGTRSEDVIGPQLWLNGLNESGERSWKNTFGTEREEQPYAITTTSDGHVGVCGYRNPSQRSNGYDGFVAKVSLPE